MREYINKEIRIDGRNIPYPVFTAPQYFEMHDRVENVDDFIEENEDIYTLVTQILALKQSCFLLRRVSHSCQSLSDNLYYLKNRLIAELREKYNYEFDDNWMERLTE